MGLLAGAGFMAARRFSNVAGDNRVPDTDVDPADPPPADPPPADREGA